MSVAVTFIVPGVPIPQGSKSPWGTEDNPQTRPWRETVARIARDEMPNGPLHGPVSVDVVFVFPRPKSHYRTGKYAEWLRESAPHWHVSTPDLDKLQRAIGDAMRGSVLLDDAQIARWSVMKVYGPQPHAAISVERLV